MPEFFDYDPLTKMRYDFDYDEETGNAIIHRTQDVTDILDNAKALRNDGITDAGIKQGWWQYATLPMSVILAMRFQKGINALDPRNIDRVVQEINTNYPHLKTTEKNMGGKNRIIHDLGKS